MTKLFVLFICMHSIIVNAQNLTVEEQYYDSLNADSKAYINELGGLYAKDSVIKFEDVAVIQRVALIKGIKSREKGPDGKNLIEDQYLIVYKDTAGKEFGFLARELPDVTSSGLISKMKDAGLKQGDDRFPEEFNF